MTWGDEFLNTIQAFAAKDGKVFFPYSAQGREMPDPPNGMEVDDFNGWLVEAGDAEAFCAQWAKNMEELIDDDRFVWARWKVKDGELWIDFEGM